MSETPPEQSRWHRMIADGRLPGGGRVSTAILSLLFVITAMAYLEWRPVTPEPPSSVTITRNDDTTQEAPSAPVQTTAPRPTPTRTTPTRTTPPPTATTTTEEPAPTTTTTPPAVPAIPGLESPQSTGENATPTTTATPAP